MDDDGWMDAPSHFFFSLEHKNGQRRLIYSLRSEIHQHAVDFYKELYKEKFQEKPQEECSFYKGLRQVLEADNIDLKAELSAQELQDALHSLKSGKAPGMDGLPAEFYKTFWPVVGDDVLFVLRDRLRTGQLPLSCRRAVLTLLPKKGDLSDLKNSSVFVVH